MSFSEIEENVNKIKELLKSEDFEVVNTGLELVISLDEEDFKRWSNIQCWR